MAVIHEGPISTSAVRAVICGTIFTSLLFGLEILAFCQYLQRFTRDRLFFQITVVLLLTFSIVGWVLGVYSSWTVSSSSPKAQHRKILFRIELILGILTLVTGFLSQLFFGKRIINLGGVKKWHQWFFLFIMVIPIIIGCTALFSFKPAEEVVSTDWRMVGVQLGLWSSAAISLILTTVLVLRLLKGFRMIRDFSPTMGSIVVRIAVIALTTGLASTVFTIIIAICDLILPADDSYPNALAFVHPQVYSTIVILSLTLRSDSEGWKDEPNPEPTTATTGTVESSSTTKTGEGQSATRTVDPYPISPSVVSFSFQNKKRSPNRTSFDPESELYQEDDEKERFLKRGSLDSISNGGDEEASLEGQGRLQKLPPEPMSSSRRHRR